MDKTQATMSVPDAPSKFPKLTTDYPAGLVPLPGPWSNLPLIGTVDKSNLAPHSPPVSMVELPRMVSTVGPELASGESLWMEGPLVMPSVLGADIPIKVERSSREDSAVDSFTDDRAYKPKCSDQGNKTILVKGSKSKSKPLTGVEAVEILAKKRHLGELQFYHFHKVESVHFRPYDLQMVPSNKAGTDYYIFSPFTVMHVQDGCNTTVLSLAEWYREAVLWRSLRDIPFFRDCLLRKAFTCRWQRNVRRMTFQRRAILLQEQLPIAVPHFRDALLQMSRLIEELKEVHWLPQDVSKMYTLVDFQMALNEKNQESQVFLEKFLLYRSMILSMVHEDSYMAHQELQLRIKQCQTNQRSQPLHQLLEQQSSLQRDLAHAESILQRLGNMASLVDCMIVQNLVTIIHREVTSFLHVVLKRERAEQVSLFQGELIFGADDKLTMFPPLHLFKDVLHGAVSSVADLIMQTFDSCSRLADGISTSSEVTTVKAGFTPDVSLSHSAGETMTSALEPKSGVLTGVSSTYPKREACVLGSSLVLPHQPPLMLRGQRLRGHYFPLSQRQLEWYLGLSATVEEVVREQAKIMQDAQAEVHTLGPLLNSIEEDFLSLVTEEIQLRSENLISELKSVVDGLQAQPTDFNDFTHFASMVERCKKMSEDAQPQLEYIHSLQETLSRNFRRITPEEVALEEQAEETVSHCLPSMANTLDNSFQSLKQDLEDMVSGATMADYLDPNQNAAQFAVAKAQEKLEKFQPVDKIFRKMIQIILNDPQVLNIVQHNKNTQSAHSFQGNSLRELITDGLSTMDKISCELTYRLDAPRRAFPRLFFLSDAEVIKLLSLHPTPMTLLPVVRKCFQGVRWLEVDSKVDIPTGQKVVNPSNGIDLISTDFARSKEQAEMNDSSTVASLTDLLSQFPLQCLLVSEEARWCSDVQKTFQSTSRVKWERVKSSLMKYHFQNDKEPLLGTQESLCNAERSCYVEILGDKLTYGYEYVGPENWMIVSSPSTDRAVLGILLALTNYRCGFVSGPCMSGKRKTVVNLGQALGQHVVTLKCHTNTHPSVVGQMLLGALKTGSWLVLQSVDSLTQGALSALGQQLSDIHQSFLSVLGHSQSNKDTGHWSNDRFEDTVGYRLSKPDMVEGRMVFTGKSISAKLSYGCVAISSNSYSVEMPENLRFATRPISLTVPDYVIIMEYERHAYLLELLVDANQPTIVVGETGSGKTTLCQSVLNQGRQLIRVPVTPLLHIPGLRKALENMRCQQSPAERKGKSMNQSGMLLFIDDLHEAPLVLGPKANVLNIARLWMHECLRTFGDRLSSEEDIQTFIKLLAEVSEGHFGKRLAAEPLTDKQDTSRSACASPHAGSVGAKSTDSKQKQAVDGNTLIKALNRSQLSEKVHRKEKSLFSSSDSSNGSDEDTCGEKPAKSNAAITPRRKRYVEKGNKTDDSQDEQLDPTFQAPKLNTMLTILKSPMLKKLRKKNQLLKEQVCHSPWVTNVDSVPPLQFLKGMRATIYSAVFCPELPEPLNSVSQHNNFKRNSVYQERRLDILAQQLALTVKGREQEEETEGNDQWACTASYAVYKARVRQLSHILRALLIPGGHGALLCNAKGTGRKTTVRLAALLSGYKLMEVHGRNEDKFREMLRDAGSLTGMQGVKMILLVHENISQAVMDELLMVMASGSVPDLYSEEDQKDLIQRIVTSGNSSRSRLKDDQALDKYFRNIQRNLHVFLLLPLIKEDADRSVKCAVLSAHIKKALSLCHCVEIYSPWTGQDLVEIAHHQFKNHPLNAGSEVDRDTLTASISWAMACIHQSAVRYAANYLPGQQPFTSQKYVELIAHYLQLCSQMRTQGQGHANRMVTILSRVRDIADIAQQSRQQVITLKDRLKTMQKDHALLLRTQETERTVCTRTRWHSTLEKSRLDELEEQALKANKQVAEALNQVTQLYNKTVNALKSLSQVDLEEVRGYRCPPEGVVLVMDAICMIFDRPRNWESSKKLLGQPHFFQELEFYDRRSIDDKLYKKLSTIMLMPEFQPVVVRSKSRACESICNWVRALYEHATVMRSIAPQQVQKKEMDASVEESRKHMQEVCMQEEFAKERYEDVQRRIEANRQGMEEVSMQVRLKDVQEREATNTLKQIEYHIAKWNARKKEIEMNFLTIPGDALILAAVITYFGPFGSDVQMELLDKWRELCLHGHTKSNPIITDSLESSLYSPPAFAIPMDKHLQKTLARTVGDEQCVDLCVSPGSVIKLLLWFYRSGWAPCWPLLADIQQHEEFRSQCMGVKGNVDVENEYGLVVSADDPNLLDKLSHGAENGLKVMVTHTERLVPSPEFLEFLVQPSGSRAPGFICPVRSSNPDFCLFFSTPLSVRSVLREIHPAILKEVQVIDLSLSSTELKELMMSEILQSENPDLWTQHFQIRSKKQSLEDKLHHEEMSLMEYVLQSFTPLQQDLAFLPRVAACHKASQMWQGDIEQYSQDLECHKPLLLHYRYITDLAVAFYRALQQVAVLSPLYLFTLSNFLTALHHTLLSKGQPNLSSGSEGSAVTKVTKRLVLQLMTHYRPCVFQSHFALLRLLVSVALFVHSEDYTKEEQEAFLHGLSDSLQVSLDSAPSLKLPSWIPSSVHTELMQLEKIPTFCGLIKSLAANADQWQEYLSFPSSTVIGPIPCQSHAHLSIMQRALLWKTLFPSWLAAVAEDLAACQLGQPVHSAPQVGSIRAPHTGCPEALARYLHKNDGPVIIQLPHPSQGVSASAHPIHWLTQIAQIPGDTRVVKTISLGTNSEKKLILRELELGAEKGHWVVLNNCHLVKEWDEEVVRKLTHILSIAAKGPKVEVDQASPFATAHVHPLFRVWFITQGENPCSVPAVVRVCALRLVCDSAWDLKEQVCSSLYCVAPHLSSSTSPHSSSSSSMEPILRCATLHSVLLQRQAFQHLGQGGLYNWTQEDLVTLIEAHTQLSKHCSDTTEALEYIAAYLVYGGHVSDSADLEAVVGVTRACLRSPSASWGSGPHTLAHIISSSGHLGFQGLDHHVQNLRDTNDPLLLGFGSGMAVEQVKLHSHSLLTLLHRSQSLLSGPRALTGTWRHHALLPDYKETQAKLLAIQTSLQHTIDGKGVGSGSLGPMRDFLLTEKDRLVEHVASLLASLSTPTCKAPSSWTECTVQALGKLEKRAGLLQDYLGEDLSSSTFFACVLSVFQNPQGFLAALIRQTAQDKQKDVSQVYLQYQVLNISESPSSPPLNRVYLGGLELHGAVWVSKYAAIQDTLSHKPCPLPLVLVWGLERADEPTRENLSPGSPQSSTSAFPVYNCPLYRDPQLTDGEWDLSEKNIITHIPLVSKIDPVLCAQRRVRLICTL
ncbi:dynein heavy chain domain-containing protein 1-like [Sardina pilchardus]|uniref:dynein heavy chain domain-containing protein 1-like n=1 Tax=Sardina pilchardus TaxID=27697 RepID=UPI002E0E1EF7